MFPAAVAAQVIFTYKLIISLGVRLLIGNKFIDDEQRRATFLLKQF